MTPEFSNPQTTVSGINFAGINREINHTLLIYQEAVRNFSQKLWPLLAHNPRSPNNLLSDTVKLGEPSTGLRKSILGLSPDLTVEEVQEFQKIVKKVKDIDLTYEEAEDQATRMVKLVLLLKQKRLLENQRS